MNAPNRFASFPPPGRAPERIPLRPRGRGAASALLGALAGLAAGAAIVAGAPDAGRTIAMIDAPPLARDDGPGRQGADVAASASSVSSVSAVLAPAIEAGAVPAPAPEAVRP